MSTTLGKQSLVLAVFGTALLTYPYALLNHVSPEQYELELAQWIGAVTIGLASIRPWAMRMGGWTAIRLRTWSGCAAVAAVAYFVNTNPLFLILGFSALSAGVLDASVGRATIASHNLFITLSRQADGK